MGRGHSLEWPFSPFATLSTAKQHLIHDNCSIFYNKFIMPITKLYKFQRRSNFFRRENLILSGQGERKISSHIMAICPETKAVKQKAKVHSGQNWARLRRRQKTRLNCWGLGLENCTKMIASLFLLALPDQTFRILFDIRKSTSFMLFETYFEALKLWNVRPGA